MRFCPTKSKINHKNKGMHGLLIKFVEQKIEIGG